MSERCASIAVIRVIGTIRTTRLTSPLRTRSTPPITEYLRTYHWAVATIMISTNRATFTCHGAPPRMVTTRNGMACRTVLAVSVTR